MIARTAADNVRISQQIKKRFLLQESRESPFRMASVTPMNFGRA